MKLGKLEKKTFLLLMAASFFNGFVIGSFQIQDIIAKKALHALDWQITILVMLWPVSSLISIWWGKLLEHSGNISKYFVITAFVGRLILIFMLFVHNYYQYLFILVIFFSFNSLISPAQNTIYQVNISSRNRGLLFGYSASLITLIALIFSYYAGRMLDVDESLFRYIFAFIGIMGCIGSLLMSLIKVHKKNFRKQPRIKMNKFIWDPIRRTFEVLKTNRDFAVFERNFFIYGIGFLIITPIIPKYLVEILKLNYTHSFLGKAIISQIPILFLAPLAGKLFDRKNPAFFSALAFGSLSLYPLILFISTYFANLTTAMYVAFLGFFIYGIAISGILITWNVSSMYFAGENDVAIFQSVHVTLTGLRGIIVPPLGFLIMKLFGIRPVFIVAIIALLIASFLNYKQYCAMDKKKFALILKAKKFILYMRKIFPFA